MNCTVCHKEFEAKRADAKFCSSTCRSKASRNVMPTTNGPEPSPSPAPEKEKKECCDQCIRFESGIHWCGSKDCGCWETPEEQVRSIEEHQRECPHPEEEAYLSRCLRCGRIQMAKMTGVYLKTRGCEKHRGSFSCNCPQKK